MSASEVSKTILKLAELDRGGLFPDNAAAVIRNGASSEPWSSVVESCKGYLGGKKVAELRNVVLGRPRMAQHTPFICNRYRSYGRYTRDRALDHFYAECVRNDLQALVRDSRVHHRRPVVHEYVVADGVVLLLHYRDF